MGKAAEVISSNETACEGAGGKQLVLTDCRNHIPTEIKALPVHSSSLAAQSIQDISQKADCNLFPTPSPPLTSKAFLQLRIGECSSISPKTKSLCPFALCGNLMYTLSRSLNLSRFRLGSSIKQS